MGYFGDIHLSNSLPSPELLPMENIQAVHQELGQAFEHNTGVAESLEQQLSKTKLREQNQYYVNQLSKETTEAINTVRDNPFEMPYANKMIRNLANEKYVNNNKLHALIGDKKNEDEYYAELNNLLKNYSAIDKGNSNEGVEVKGGSGSKYKKVDGTYSKDVINTAKLITKSLNNKEAIYDPETGSLENSFNGYNPVAKPDIEQKLINNISKLNSFYQKNSNGNLRQTNSSMWLTATSIKELPPKQIIKLADIVLDDDPEYQDWLEQKALFEKVANTERDENGLLKLDENGKFLETRFIERVRHNKEFRTALKTSFEVDINANKKDKEGNPLPPKYTAKNEEVGMIGSNDNDFDKYFSDSKNREMYYNWFKENEKRKLKSDAAAAFAFRQVDHNFYRNEDNYLKAQSNLDNIKANVQHATSVNGNIIVTPSFRHEKFKNALNYAQKTKDKKLEAKTNEGWLKYISSTMELDKGKNDFFYDYGEIIFNDKNLKRVFLKEILSNSEIVSRIKTARDVYNEITNNGTNKNKEKDALDPMIDAILNKELAPALFVIGSNRHKFGDFAINIYNAGYKDDVLKAIRATLYDKNAMNNFDKLSAKHNTLSFDAIMQELTSYDYRNKPGTPLAYYTTTNTLANDQNSNFVTINGKNHHSYMMEKIRSEEVFFIDGTKVPKETASTSIKYEVSKGINRHQMNERYYNSFKMSINGQEIEFIGDNGEKTSQIHLANSNTNQAAKNIFMTDYDYIKNTMDYVSQYGYNTSVYVVEDLKNAIYGMSKVAMREFEAISSYKDYPETFTPQTFKIYDPKNDNTAVDYKKIVVPQFDATGNITGVKVGDTMDELNKMSIDNFYLKAFLEVFGNINPMYIKMAQFAGFNIE